MTDPLGETSINGKKQEKSVLNLIRYNNNRHNMLVLDKRWKKHNEFQLTKKLDMNDRK